MINKISGIIDEIISDGYISVNCNGISYIIAVPGGLFSKVRLTKKIGDKIELYTIYYIENSVGGSALTPKLIGFGSAIEREFFEKYITVKGLGIKSALKSLVISVRKLAIAIENSDIAVIKKLPGIGGRTSEKIIAELKGKLAKYALLKEEQITMQSPAVDGVELSEDKLSKKQKEIDYTKLEMEISEEKESIFEIEEEASQILRDLGYTSKEINEIFDKIKIQNIKFTDTEELLQIIFKVFKSKR
ncbi:MAG TPA: OB-fold domain-containing protein [bacterium]|nr:OB-fold domain-containing protein [bacterium]HPP88119.1 OB-fold domain-containing protein [bacterium]